MAKTKKEKSKTYEEVSSDLRNIFDTVGGSISEEVDKDLLDAIESYDCPDSFKIKFLIGYGRELEREIHYTQRRK